MTQFLYLYRVILQGLWRFWLRGNHILVVGHPFSPYSVKYIPLGVSPIQLASDEPPKDQR